MNKEIKGNIAIYDIYTEEAEVYDKISNKETENIINAVRLYEKKDSDRDFGLDETLTHKTVEELKTIFKDQGLRIIISE